MDDNVPAGRMQISARSRSWPSIKELHASIRDHWPVPLALLIGCLAGFVAFYYASQPLLELEAFRQTQTALTSYWMLQEGWRIPYQTPVAILPAGAIGPRVEKIKATSFAALAQLALDRRRFDLISISTAATTASMSMPMQPWPGRCSTPMAS